MQVSDRLSPESELPSIRNTKEDPPSSDQESLFDLNLASFNPQRDTYIRLLRLPKNNLSNNANIEVQPEYIGQDIFSRDFGRISKGRWGSIDQIVIGRQKTHEPQVDINLIHDNYVSQRHCAIRLKEGWNNTRKLTRDFLCFLMLTKQQQWSQLNNDLLLLMWKFVKPKKQFYIQDLGSSLGTQINLKQPRILSPGMSFKIPFNTCIRVLQISYYTSEEIKTLQPAFSQSMTTLVTLSTIACWNPYLKLQIGDHTFILLGVQGGNYTIGRHESNHIFINKREVSRCHCTISYTRMSWVISDGYNGVGSRNGTFREVGRWSGMWGEEKELENRDVIYVGDTYFRFEVHNN